MKGNLTNIIGWLAYESRISTLPGVGPFKLDNCLRMCQLHSWHCNGIVHCENCPFIRYKKTYLENY